MNPYVVWMTVTACAFSQNTDISCLIVSWTDVIIIQIQIQYNINVTLE